MVIQINKLYKPITGLLAVLMAVAVVTTLNAQTPTLQAKLALRPLTRDDISAYKLPATTQVSGGLYTVGLGQPAYLEAQVDIAIPASDIGVTWTLTTKPTGSNAALKDSPLGTDVPLYEPSDRVVSQIAGRTLLRPDVEGVYTVTATIATKNNGTAKIGQTVVGATYVGANTCTSCHGGGLAQVMATSWSKTAHATMLKNGMNGVLGDHYGPGCLPCHTVGYDADPAAVNGGFDDVAAQLKWTFPTVLKDGTWEAMPDALKNLGNIQCENCHGPGSIHASSGGGIIGISVSNSSGVCAQCHAAATHHIKPAEWNNSMHAVTTRDPSGAGREGCVGCHTGTGFMDRVNGAKAVNTVYAPINCQTCHEPHGQTAPGENAHLVRNLESVTLADGTLVTNGGLGTLCMNCHQSRQNAAVYAANSAASARFGPHHGPQTDMLEGVNGFSYRKTLPTSAHASIVKDTCVTCHMQTVDAADPALGHVGGHTFKPSWSGDGKTPAVDLVAACQNCHGKSLTTFDFPRFDLNDNGNIQGVQTEVRRLLDQLALMLPPAGKPKTSLTIDSTWTRPQLEAAYNWQFVMNDGSFGIHNLPYAVALLEASIADLNATANKK